MTIEESAEPVSITAMRSEVDQLRELFDQHQQIMVLGHKDADGDTLGCSLAFGEALRALGKDVSVVMPQPLSQKYSWMPGFDHIVERPPAGATSGWCCSSMPAAWSGPAARSSTSPRTPPS